MVKGKTDRRVEAKWVVRLEDGVKLMVKKGDEVVKGDVLAMEEKKKIESFDMTATMSTMGKEGVEEWIRQWRGKKVGQTDLMAKKKGLLGKKIFFPVEGKCLSVDEFFNVCFEVGEKVKRKIVSPVGARVERVAGDKMVLGFEAMEFRGEAMVEGKVWGESSLEDVSKVTDLDSDFEGKIVLSTDADEAFLAKMEVVGVLGLITKEKKKEDFLAVEVPVLNLDKKSWDDLTALSTENERRMLLNTRVGRLLLVV